MRSPELADRILALMVGGMSLRAICDMEDMPSRETIFAWLREDEAFAAQYSTAQEARAAHYAEEIVGIADEESPPEDRRVRIDARKWVASKLLPKRYGDKVTQDHTGTVTVEVRKCA